MPRLSGAKNLPGCSFMLLSCSKGEAGKSHFVATQELLKPEGFYIGLSLLAV
jgi:hypothetical protein